MQNTVIIIGGASFIGSALCRHVMAETDVNAVCVDKLTYARTRTWSVFEKAANGEKYKIDGGSERPNMDVLHGICDLLSELRPRNDVTSYRASSPTAQGMISAIRLTARRSSAILGGSRFTHLRTGCARRCNGISTMFGGGGLRVTRALRGKVPQSCEF